MIKNGKVVNVEGIIEQDVYIEDGVIKALGKNINVSKSTRIIDANGKYVIPGGIDPHTHCEMQFMGTTTIDDFYTGTKAAVAGGTTMISEFIQILIYILHELIPFPFEQSTSFSHKKVNPC